MYKTKLKFSHILYLMAILLIGLHASDLFAQQVPIDVFNEENGMPFIQISDVLQDSTGALWISTWGDGLIRYDGYNFTTLSDKDGLTNLVINDIFLDSTGRLWIATDGGLNYLENQKVIPVNAEQKETLRIFSIVELANHILLFGTDHGLYQLKNDQLVRFKDFGIKKTERVDKLFRHKTDLWVCTDEGIYQVKQTIQSFYNYPENDPLIEVWDLLIRNDNIPIIATNRGLFTITDTVLTPHPIQKKLKSGAYYQVMKCSNGKLWLSGEYGIYVIDGSKIQYIGEHQGLPYLIVRALYEDREHSVWIGADGGLSKISSNFISFFDTKDGLKSGLGWTVWQKSKHSDLLVTIDTAMFSISKDGQVSPFSFRTDQQDAAYPIFRDHLDRIWYGSGYNLMRVENDRIVNVSKQLHLIQDDIISLLEDSRGRMWVGTLTSGVFQITGGQVVRYSTENGLVSNAVNTILEDHTNTIWLATENGINSIRNGQIDTLQSNSGLAAGSVISMARDQSGNIWIGTYGAGVGLIRGSNPARVEMVYNTNTGLSNNAIESLIFDDDDHLWAGTNYGINRIHVRDYLESQKIQVDIFDSGSGFRGKECNQNSVFKDSEGNLWFGTIKGFYKFDLSKIRTNHSEPKTRITALRVNRQNFDWEKHNFAVEKLADVPDSVAMDYFENNLTFSFHSFSLTAPREIFYQHRLLGFEDEWSDQRRDREAVYTNLAPGIYHFQVRSCNSDGIWNTKPAAMTIMIRSPYWKKAWFIVLAVSFLFLIPVTIVRIRTSTLRRQKEHLQHLVDLRTAEVEKEKRTIESINKDLEGRVLARTNELQLANQKLHNEISEREKAEAVVRESLREKEYLLKEIHHRVKNNLQIISSMLYLQSRQTEHEESKNTLIESQSRIRSMAFIHENLYKSENMADILLSDYIPRLLNHLRNAFGRNGAIVYKTQIEQARVPIVIAVPCGLIINEALTNAIKYAFPKGKVKNPTITIELKVLENGDYRILIRDNGVGFPKDFDPKKSESLGFTLIQSLCAQIDAPLEVRSENGTTVQFTIPQKSLN